MNDSLDWLKVNDLEFLKDKSMRETVEDACGRHGFRVAWIVDDLFAYVWVWEIIGYTSGKIALPTFEYFDASGRQQFVDSIQDARECYINGFVKYDGCSQFDMAYQHWDGAGRYKKHIALLEYIWKRAFELMEREPEGEWGATHYLEQ